MESELAHDLRQAPPAAAEEAHTTRVPADGELDLEAFRERSLQKGVNPFVYRVIRALFLPFFLIYFRLQRTGREHLPASGPLLLAANHRSVPGPVRDRQPRSPSRLLHGQA